MKRVVNESRILNRSFLLMGALLALPLLSPALAHPGHELLENGAVHLLTSVDHIIMLASAGVLSLALGALVKNRTGKRSFQAAALVMFICAAGAASF